MSIKDRLAKKTQDLVMPVKGDGSAGSANPMRTGPGQMLMVNSLMKESNEKVAQLEARLRQFEGGLPVLLLDPGVVHASRWANRSADAFTGVAFEQLRSEIAESGGNVQPIKVRTIAGEGERFEIVFGHRRHRACLELQVPVLAMVEELSDAELFKQMDRENRARADLSPWEQGMMYRRALSDRLFSSREQLARELGIDAGNLSKALRLADLDDAVVQSFRSPLDLQYRWAKPLADALIHDRERVMKVVAALKIGGDLVHTPKQIFDRLVGGTLDEIRVEQVRIGKRVVAEIHIEGKKTAVRFTGDGLGDEQITALKNFIATNLFA